MTEPRSSSGSTSVSLDKRPPLKLIAEQLGISKMTVSRGLREGTSVDSELRTKIREAALQIGYQPDTRISQVMSAIRKSQTPVYRETLALVGTHGRKEKGGSNYFFDGISAGATQRALQLGFRLDEIRIAEQGITGRALSRILQSRGIRGVLIAPPSAERNHPHIWLDWKKFCCVLIGRSFANTGIPRVQSDHYLSCVLAMRRLKRLGYRRIALVLSQSMDERTVRMARSAFFSFHPLPLRECEKLIYTSDRFNPKTLAKWMTQSQPEVIVANFENPFPQPEHLTAAGKVELASLNWNNDHPEIAGVNQQLSLIGQHAIDLLSVRLQRHLFGLEETAPTINVPGAWVDGPSIRSAAPAAISVPKISPRASLLNKRKPALSRK